MKPIAPSAALLIVIVLATPGCNSWDEKPRGHGASGRKLDVLAKAEIGMERFYKFSPEHQQVIARLDRPFEEVAKPGPNAASKPAQEATAKVRDSWNKNKIVYPDEGRTVKFRATITTTIGDLVIDCFEGFSPDVARNFIARLHAGVYDGQVMTVEDDAFVFGPPIDKQAYTMPARTVPYTLPKGSVFAFLTGGRATGERFGISLKNVPGGASKVSIFGFVNQPAMPAVLGRFLDEHNKKPGSIVVKGVRIHTFDTNIFDGGNVRLPSLNPDGELAVPDVDLFVQAIGSETHPRDMPLNPDQLKKPKPTDKQPGKEAPKPSTIPEKKSDASAGPPPAPKKEPPKSP
jgi:hypothetical protein